MTRWQEVHRDTRGYERETPLRLWKLAMVLAQAALIGTAVASCSVGFMAVTGGH